MKRYMVRSLLLSICFILVTLPTVAYASGDPTAMSVAAPPSTELGQRVTLQALLVAADGQPIAGAPVVFSMPFVFMGVGDEALIARAVTNAEGVAIAFWNATRAGKLTIRAAFPGDNRYAPSRASVVMEVVGDTQLYAEHAGVHLPGINTPPPTAPSLFTTVQPGLRLLGSLWPALSGWPIALVLLIVWALYAVAVAMTFRISSAALNAPNQEEHR